MITKKGINKQFRNNATMPLGDLLLMVMKRGGEYEG
jgi:hypothetical protein